MKLVPRVIGLRTVWAMMVDRFVQVMSSLFGALLAIIGAELRRAQQHNESG